ncbi:MAG: hypothetical protein HDR12_02755 [Lachnospiraceae bacterium]|nr:hypothetical protein [Lachnospiraceae bacterium]
MKKIINFRKSNSGDYLSDEALERLISEIETEPLLQPPKEFKNDIVGRIRQKRKYMKNVQLFSYSTKVILATAAAIAIVLFVPENIRSETDMNIEQQQHRQERQLENEGYEESPIWQLNRKMNEYYDKLNDGLNQLLRMEVHLNEKEEK